MDELSQASDSGLPPVLTKENVSELQGLIAEAAQHGEKFLAASGVDPDVEPQEPLPAAVNQIQNVLSRDYKALSEYDVNEPTSLPQLQTDSRGLTIDLRNRRLNTIGNKTNQRHFLTVVDGLGRKRSGVFTKEKKVDVKAKFTEMMDRAKAACTSDEARAELDKLVPEFRAALVRQNIKKVLGGTVKADESDEVVIGMFLKMIHGASLTQEQRNDFGFAEADLTEEAFGNFMKFAKIDLTKVNPEAQIALFNGLNDLSNDVAFQVLSAQQELRDGDRLDSQNTAMSQIAGLLGSSSLLAKSQNMKFIDRDGKTVEGTFMDYADGVDLVGDLNMFATVAREPFSNDECRNSLYKQIADLQVLDFLCLNSDRHYGNIVYKINREGQIYGIQGIDNDTAFGPATVKYDSVKELRVISRSMADRINNISPQMLRFSLRGSGLSKEEVDRTVDRLQMLTQAVNDKDLTVVEDEQFHELMDEEIYPENGGTNMFAQIKNEIPPMAKAARKRFGGHVPIENRDVPEYANVSTTDRDYTVGGVRDSVKDVADLVENRETGFKMDDLVTIRGKSGKFKKLMDQVRTTARLQDGLFESRKVYKDKNGNSYASKWKANDAMSIREAALQPTLFNVNNAFEELGKRADAYLAMKMKDRRALSTEDLLEKKCKNPYEKSHVEFALNVRRIVNEYKAKTAEADGPDAEKKQHLMEQADRTTVDEMRKAREAAKKIQQEHAEQLQNPILMN